MPVTPTYPGVYIEEIPSGVRTITGVATSITAFIGRTQWGPVSEPTIINNWGDFERLFGGLRADKTVPYVVRDFLNNGGRQGLIVRLYADPAQRAGQDVAEAASEAADASDPTPQSVAEAARSEADGFTDEPESSAANSVAEAAEAAAGEEGATAESVKDAAVEASEAIPATIARLRIPISDEDTMTLEAANPGDWGNSLKVTVSYEGINDEVADRYNVAISDLFNLEVMSDLGAPEFIRNVTVVESSRRLDRVLEQESQWVRVPVDENKQPELPDSRPLEPSYGTDDNGEPIEEIVVAEGDRGFEGKSLEIIDYQGSRSNKTGIYALEKADLFNILCIPPDFRDGDTHPIVYSDALNYCQEQRAMLLVDPPRAWGLKKEIAANKAKEELTKQNKDENDLNLTGKRARNAALYFPRVLQPDPLREGQMDTFVPCGVVAGILARTDVQRGVWKAPAGVDATLNGIAGLQVNLTDDENGLLNPIGINCLRNFRIYGNVVWGARTLRGADQLADEYKYVPVRRLVLFLEESLYRGTQWVVFEPNDEPLWAQIRLNIGTFMNGLFRQGAFQGQSPKEAYFVKCDSETTTQYDIDRGIVNIIVGFAPLKPAEFVIIKFQQITRQAAA